MTSLPVFVWHCQTWRLKMKGCGLPGALRTYPRFLSMASIPFTHLPTTPGTSPSLSHLPHCPKWKPYFPELALCNSVQLPGKSTPHLVPSKNLAQWPSDVISYSFKQLFGVTPLLFPQSSFLLGYGAATYYFSLNPQHLAKSLAYSKYSRNVFGAWETFK